MTYDDENQSLGYQKETEDMMNMCQYDCCLVMGGNDYSQQVTAHEALTNI